MTTTPSEPFPAEVPEADWAEQHTAAGPEGDDPGETAVGGHRVTTEADTADLAEQDTIAYSGDDEV